MAIDIAGQLQDLLMRILGSDSAAASVAADTSAAVASYGLADVGETMTVADFQAQLAAACGELEAQLPAEVHAALVAYTEGNGAALSPPAGATSGVGGSSGGGALPHPAAASTALTQTVLQEQLQYVTYVTHENNPTIINDIYQDYSSRTDIDNSINLDLEGDLEGDIDIDSTNVNATGDGAVAAGDDVENAVTGDGSVLVDGDNFGDVTTGDGNVLNDGVIEGGVATGAGAVATGQDSNAVVGDGNTAVQADGNIEDTSVISGDVGGDAVSIGDVDDASLAFGDGAQSSNISDVDNTGNIGQTTGDGVTNVDTTDTATAQGGGDAFGDIDDAAVQTGGGGDTTNVSDIEDFDGGAVAGGGGDATGSDINDAFNDNEAPVAVEQGAGDQDAEQSLVDEGGDPMEGMEP
jgi:hypothetical protein